LVLSSCREDVHRKTLPHRLAESADRLAPVNSGFSTRPFAARFQQRFNRSNDPTVVRFDLFRRGEAGKISAARGSQHENFVNTLTLGTKIISTVALMAFAFNTASAATDRETEQELTKIMRQWAEARMKGDVALLEKLYAKEFLITGADGMLVERDTDTGLFARKEIKPQSIGTTT
jgi:hypothetical protein